MAARGNTDSVLTFQACATELRDGRLARVGFQPTAVKQWRMDELCPVHKSTDCIESYVVADHLARWSLWNFRTWRSMRRQARGARKAVAS